MKLVLDNHRKPFRPGENITGHLELGPSDASVQKIHVILEGRAKTKTVESRSNSKSTYRARAPLLFQVEPVATSSSIAFSADTKYVPFSIQIPTEVPRISNIPAKKNGLLKTYWTYDWGKPKANFANAAGHTLPPTLNAGPKGQFTKSSCYVQYSITAVGSRENLSLNPQTPQGGLPPQLEPCRFDTRPFWLQSECCEVTASETEPTRRVAQRVVISNARLLPQVPSKQAARMSIKDKFKNMAHPTSVPEISFVAFLSVPTHLRVGDRLPLTLNLKREDQAEVLKNGKVLRPRVPFPDVQIDGIEIKVKANTHVRTCGSLKMHTDEWSETCWADTQAHGLARTVLPKWTGEVDAPPAYADSASSPKTVSVCSTIDSDAKAAARASHRSTSSATHTIELESGHSLPSRLIPTFETYNISREYTIRVTVALSCAGEKSFINFNGPLDVVSRPASSTRPSHLPPAFEDIFDTDVSVGQAVAGAALVGAGAGVGARFAAASVEASSHKPPQRIDSGVSGLKSSSGRWDREEDWGEYSLFHDDKLATQEMASAVVEGLGVRKEVYDHV